MRRAVAYTLLATLAGCASAEPDYYVLQPVAGRADSSVTGSIEVRRPGLAGFLDRADVVVDGTSFRLTLGAGARWGEPLGDMIERVLSQDLAQRLPASQVFGEGGAIGVASDLRVDVDVQQFGGASGGTAILISEIVIERRHDHVVLGARHVQITAARQGSGAASLAAAMSDLLGQIADQISTDLAPMTGRSSLSRG